jgi:two-component system sensor histidine kinase MprB
VGEADVEVASGDDKIGLRTVTVDGRQFRMLTRNLPDGGAVQIARSLDESEDLLEVLQLRIVGIAGALAVLAAVGGWVLARRTTRPLRSLTASVDTVAATHDFSVPVEVTGRDETARLARGFNDMLADLDLSREQQRRLVQDAAHELRTPLTSITANVDWLARVDDVDAGIRTETMRSIRRELGELNQVITEIIELATDRRELPDFEALDLADVAAEAAARFRERVDREVELRAVESPVLGDPDALGRAADNLLSNADKYSPAGAPVAVDVDGGGLWVTDRGGGIPEDERARVFDRFYRREEDRSRSGSGLGLSIVASIVDAHDGDVEVTGAPGGGARVGFRLPPRTQGNPGPKAGASRVRVRGAAVRRSRTPALSERRPSRT